ncbi:hypothetical protein [Streptomyces sp. 891-h]|uniref:hypothetical protein n=1 Tax=Streptomyces sp. 891-h TaxID=2720714 RepID=UPI001FA9D052|nr:hypothetical protein [Streptomyces sp. 891-h]UNZ19560.1 hypothetical protein HC362_23510 [Streptomyces sp. 891-h]
MHDKIPELSRMIAAYDLPEDGPMRPHHELRAAVSEAVDWRVGAQYLRIARKVPGLQEELARALAAASGADRCRATGGRRGRGVGGDVTIRAAPARQPPLLENE